MMFIGVTATDRTDTEFMYVFDKRGRLLEVAHFPGP